MVFCATHFPYLACEVVKVVEDKSIKAVVRIHVPFNVLADTRRVCNLDVFATQLQVLDTGLRFFHTKVGVFIKTSEAHLLMKMNVSPDYSQATANCNSNHTYSSDEAGTTTRLPNPAFLTFHATFFGSAYIIPYVFNNSVSFPHASATSTTHKYQSQLTLFYAFPLYTQEHLFLVQPMMATAGMLGRLYERRCGCRPNMA